MSDTEETFEAYLRRKWPQFNGQNGALDFEQFILCAIEAWWKLSSAQRCEIVDKIRKSPSDAAVVSALLHHQVGDECEICDKVREIVKS